MSERENYPADSFKPRELEILTFIADGLTNHEIAERLFIAPTTVRWYNRSIYSKLGVHSRTLAVARARDMGLFDSELTSGEQTLADVSVSLHNFPAQTTPFVGREREIAKVRQLLTATRLLTLTGPGGAGKTRLTLQVARAVQDYFPDGIWFAPLAAVRDPDMVIHALASVLDVKEKHGVALQTSLVKEIQDKQLLLVIDNFEHVIQAASVISTLLKGAPRIKILVTSREVLRLYGEQEYPIPPLTVPDWLEPYTPQELADFEAVTLFLQRVRAVHPGFDLTDENVGAVARLCARLDGLPLAIELAAARIKLLSVEQILTRLEEGLGILGQGPRDAPARQRTLRATIDWSYGLLTAEEQRLFTRLSVFYGGWTLDAMPSVCGDGLTLDMFDGLASLVDKSLVQQVESQEDEPRFTMLETFREYAADQMDEGEAGAIRARHRDWFLHIAELGDAGLRSPNSRNWFRRLQQEEHNLRAALEWTNQESRDNQDGMRLAGALWNYWHMCGKFQEGRGWLDLLLSQVESIASVERAQMLNGAGVLAYRQGDYGEVTRLCGEALQISEQLGNRDGAALALHYLAHVAQQQGDYDEATKVLTRSLHVYREQENDWGCAQTLNCLGDLHRQLGRDDLAITLLEEALDLQRKLESQRGIAVALHNLGHVLCRRNEVVQAAACFRESLEIATMWAGEPDVVLCIGGFAGVAAASEKPERAARLLGAVDAILPVVGYVLEPPDRADYDRIVSETRAQLDEAGFRDAWEDGCQLSLDDAVAYVLNEPLS